MFLSKLSSHIIPIYLNFKDSIYFTALFKAREINKVIEEALTDNEIVCDCDDIDPIIFQIQEGLSLDKKRPLISLLYHLPKFSIVVEIYKDKVVVIKSDEHYSFECEYDKRQEIKTIF